MYAYDLCTGNEIGYVTLNGNVHASWGMDYDNASKTFYITSKGSGGDVRGLWVIQPTMDDFLNNASFDPLIVRDDGNISIGDFEMPNNSFGVTFDDNGFIYIVEQEGNFFNGCYRVLKYSSAGELLAIGPSDCDNSDGAGWQQATGIVYSATSDLLYVSSQNGFEDCVTSFNTD